MPSTVKICGLSTARRFDAALEAGADMVGFVFFERSPRFVGLDHARELAAEARGRAKIVALGVDAADRTLAAIVARSRPIILQLHGRESPERVAEIKRAFGVPVDEGARRRRRRRTSPRRANTRTPPTGC